MSALFVLLLAMSPFAAVAPQQAPEPTTERIVVQKDGGPGHGPDQPYSIRETGATDLEGFVGGKQVVFIAPYDVFLLVVIVTVIVVLVIVL